MSIVKATLELMAAWQKEAYRDEVILAVNGIIPEIVVLFKPVTPPLSNDIKQKIWDEFS